jgi:hypothetical protein
MDVRVNYDEQSSIQLGASCCNLLSTIFAIIAACSPWWSYGYFDRETPPHSGHYPVYGAASVSASPFIAGYAWKTVPSYSCPYCWQTISLYPVYWGTFGAQEVCVNNSRPIYQKWAQPLGYCSTDSAGAQIFTAPWNPIAVQGLIIASCVLVGVASLAGCIAGGIQSRESFICDLIAYFFSFVALILLCATFSSWSSWEWVQLVQSQTGFAMPAWINENEGIMTALPTQMVYGPGWGLCLASFILTFFATALHAWSAFVVGKEDLIEGHKQASMRLSGTKTPASDSGGGKNGQQPSSVPPPPVVTTTTTTAATATEGLAKV